MTTIRGRDAALFDNPSPSGRTISQAQRDRCALLVALDRLVEAAVLQAPIYRPEPPILPLGVVRSRWFRLGWASAYAVVRDDLAADIARAKEVTDG